MHGVEYFAELLYLVVGVVIFADALIGIKLLVVEVFDFLPEGPYHLLLLADIVSAAALAGLQFLHAGVVLVVAGDVQRDVRQVRFLCILLYCVAFLLVSREQVKHTKSHKCHSTNQYQRHNSIILTLTFNH